MTSTKPAAERRRHQRLSVAVRVQVSELGEVHGALTRDLSAGGLFIESKLAYPRGAKLPVRIIDPRNGAQIPTLCEVVRAVKDGTGKMRGLGLAFTDLDPEMTKRLQAFIEEVAKPAVAAAGPEQSEPAVPVSTIEAELRLDAVAIPNLDASRDGLHPMLLHILGFVDGVRTHDEVSHLTGLSPVEVMAGMRELKKIDVVALIPAQKEAAVPASKAVQLSQPESVATQEYASQKAREALSDAVRAERAGRFGEAVSLLEQALALGAPNTVDIHVRLARLAIGPLANASMARMHTEALRRANPESAEAAQLEAELEARQQEVAAAREPAKQPAVVEEIRSTVAPRKPFWRRRSAIAAAALVFWAALAGYNLWRWVVPHGPRPTAVEPAAVAVFVPASRVLLYQGSLYVTVSGEWTALAEPERKKHLADLARWAADELSAVEVVLATQEPVLVGRARGGEVTVY